MSLSEKQLEVLKRNQFKKGQPSANPSGRPKGIYDAAREITGDGIKALTVLLDIAEGRIAASARDRTQAAVELLNRAYGKAPEAHVQLAPDSDTKDDLLQLSLEQIRALGRQLRDPLPGEQSNGTT